MPATSVNMPAHSVNMPAPSVNMPAPSVNMPSSSVNQQTQSINRSMLNKKSDILLTYLEKEICEVSYNNLSYIVVYILLFKKYLY